MVKRLLCVDDDRITLTFIKLLVTKASFASEIITKMNGKEAIDYYGELSASSTNYYPAYPIVISFFTKLLTFGVLKDLVALM